MTFRISISPEYLRIFAWNTEECDVVYNAQSGDTHLLDRVAVELLQLIMVSPRSTEQLVVAIGDLLVPEDRGHVRDVVDAVLFSLQYIGLICNSPS